MRNYGNPGSLAKVYARLHANRFDHIEQARRAREYQARIAEDAAEQTRALGRLCLGMAIGLILVTAALWMHA
jgi:hypothetical protein